MARDSDPNADFFAKHANPPRIRRGRSGGGGDSFTGILGRDLDEYGPADWFARLSAARRSGSDVMFDATWAEIKREHLLARQQTEETRKCSDE